MIQTVLAIVMMVIVVLLMLGVNRLSRHKNTEDEKQRAARLRDDVNHSPLVMSKDSLFHDFLTGEKGEKGKHDKINKSHPQIP